MKSKKPICGLCGKTKDLTKAPCCNNWICDDNHKYVLFSYERNSCYRNHTRYTLCSFHYQNKHKGKWQNCKECKDRLALEDYVDFGTNDFNFEKLKDAPEITIKCVNCEFSSNSMQDFSFQTSKGFYCNKQKYQKVATSF